MAQRHCRNVDAVSEIDPEIRTVERLILTTIDTTWAAFAVAFSAASEAEKLTEKVAS